MNGDIAARLQARGRALAQAAAARLQRRVAQSWQGFGTVDSGGDGVRLVGRGVASRRHGGRSFLPDPSLLWPGDE